eukprot:15469152-Alexandrium_andersonii.AAC.1
MAVSVNQNPRAGFMIHSTWNALHTLLANSGIIYSLPHKTFLTSIGHLQAQGFPVGAYSENDLLTSFNSDRPEGVPKRKRPAVAGQAGNSMN